MHARLQRPRDPRNAGFTLMEVLIAMGIFAVGAIAVAAIFPSAIVLQRGTIEAVVANQAADGAKATMLARGFNMPDTVATTWVSTLNVNEPTPILTAPPAPQWSLADRSMAVHSADAERRDSYWVPLALKKGGDELIVPDVEGANPPAPTPPFRRRSNELSQNVFVYYFVLHRNANETYPKPALAGGNLWANPNDPETVPGVRSVGVNVDTGIGDRPNKFAFDNSGDLVRVGDKVLDNLGEVYTVIAVWDDNTGVDVDPNIGGAPAPDRIWFSPRGACRLINSVLVTPQNRLIH